MQDAKKLAAGILALAAIFLVLWIAFGTRLQSLGDPHMLEFDTVYFHNAAERIVTGGELPRVEEDRYYPLLYDGGDLHVPTYSIALLCKINPFCLETFEGVKSAAKWYAPIFTFLTIITLFYLGHRAGRDWFVGGLLFAIVPGALFRSVAGFSDKDTAAFFFMVLATYFVYRYVQERERLAPVLLYSILAGVAMGLGAMSLSSYILFVVPVVLFHIFQVIFRYRAGKDVFGTAVLVLLPMLMKAGYGSAGGLWQFSDSRNLILMGSAAFLIISYFVLRLRMPFLSGKGNERAYRLAAAVVVTVAIAFLAAAAKGQAPASIVGRVFSEVADPLRSSVHGSSVGENQPTSWAWPWEPFFWQGGNAYWEQMKLVFPIALLTLTIPLFTKRDEDILTAFFLGFNIYAASRGMRLFMNLMPIAAFAAGQAIAFLFRAGFGPQGIRGYIKAASVILVMAAFAQIYVGMGAPGILAQARGIHTSVNEEWFENFKWTDLNMRAESPVVAWWDYGYWIQYFARRPSVADGGNRILKMDEELGLMFTETNEDKAAAWMLSLPYPEVKLVVSKPSGEEVTTFDNGVFAPEYYANFIPDSHLAVATCRDPSTPIPKVCPGFVQNVSATLLPGKYRLDFYVTYRGMTHHLAASLDTAGGVLSESTLEEGYAVFQDYLAQKDGTVIAPFLELSPGGLLSFGYNSTGFRIAIPHLMTHDATMIGKMYWASRIGGRPTQYLSFQLVGDRDTPLGPAKVYAAQHYFIAMVDANGTTIPLIGSSGQPGYGVLSKIVTREGVLDVDFGNQTKTPGAVYAAGPTAFLMPDDAAGSVFTETFILDGGPSRRFREVFNNGFAKSFYVT